MSEQSNNILRLIEVLRKRGFSVHITGIVGAEAHITSSFDDTSDMSWAGFGDTTEDALVAAARACLADLSETVILLSGALPAEVPHA